MSDYEKLSSTDRHLIDDQINRNLEQQYERGGFGSDPVLAKQNRDRFIENNREYFTQPENLDRLRQNEITRQENMARSLEQYRSGGGPEVGGSAATLAVLQTSRERQR